MGWLADAFRSALGRAEGGGPTTWTAAVRDVYGGSTRDAADAAGVTQRTIQRWMAGEEGGSGAQSRRPDPSRLAGVRSVLNVQRIREGAPVSYDFEGGLDMRAGGKAGRSGSFGTQSRNTNGFVGMDPGNLDDLADALLEEDDDEIERQLSGAMFGPDSDYSIPPSPDYPAIVRILRFRLNIG